ncbi:alpha/beta hydrolase family protein [Litorivivens sp.]|uniref:alpha/beta hydrolase family protein n=1 Tax=Litorivivens sp. TaxID=2020868 RepID=UPI00356713A7
MRRLVMVLVVMVFGCGSEPLPQADAKPLTASRDALVSIPGYLAGPYKPQVVDGLTLAAPELANETIELRVWWPQDAQGAIPVVLFSHGNWSDRHKYDRLLEHWASHGYAVIAPTHLDGRSMARGIFNSLRFGQLGLIDARAADLQFLMDNLGSIQAQLPQGVALQVNKLVVAGHSFGAFTAQQFAGAIASDEGAVSRAGDPRVVGVIALSPPGPMFDVIHERSWLNMRGPVLVTTGTWDTNPQFWPDWRMHLMSHETAPGGQQFALVVEGADHYLGNLICRPEREEAPQRDALTMVNAASVSFLNAYLRSDSAAAAFLQSESLQDLTGGFARLTAR